MRYENNNHNFKESRGMGQRLVSLVLSLILCWQLLPVMAMADTKPVFEDVTVEFPATPTDLAEEIKGQYDVVKERMGDVYAIVNEALTAIASPTNQTIEAVKAAKQGQLKAAVTALKTEKDKYIQMWVDFCAACPGTLPTTADWKATLYENLYNAVVSGTNLHVISENTDYDFEKYLQEKEGMTASGTDIFGDDFNGVSDCFTELEALIGTADDDGLANMLYVCADALYENDRNNILDRYKDAEAAMIDASASMTPNERAAAYAKWVGFARVYYTLSLKALGNVVNKVQSTAAGKISGYMPAYEAEKFTQAITMNMNDWTALASKGSPTDLDTARTDGFAVIISTLKKLESLARQEADKAYSPFCDAAIKTLEENTTLDATDSKYGVTKADKVRSHLRLEVAQLQVLRDVTSEAGKLMTADPSPTDVHFDYKMNVAATLALRSQLETWLAEARTQYENYDHTVQNNNDNSTVGSAESAIEGIPTEGGKDYNGFLNQEVPKAYLDLYHGKLKADAEASATDLQNKYNAALAALDGNNADSLKSKLTAANNALQQAQSAYDTAQSNYRSTPTDTGYANALANATEALGQAKKTYNNAKSAYDTQKEVTDQLKREWDAQKLIYERYDDGDFGDESFTSVNYSSMPAGDISTAISSGKAVIERDTQEAKELYASLTDLIQGDPPASYEGCDKNTRDYIIRYQELLTEIKQQQNNVANAQRALIMRAEPQNLDEAEKRAKTALLARHYAKRDVAEFNQLEKTIAKNMTEALAGQTGYWKDAADTVANNYLLLSQHGLENESPEDKAKVNALEQTSYKSLNQNLSDAEEEVVTALEYLVTAELRDENNLTPEELRDRQESLKKDYQGVDGHSGKEAAKEDADTQLEHKAALISATLINNDNFIAITNGITAEALQKAAELMRWDEYADVQDWANYYAGSEYRDAQVNCEIARAEYVTPEDKRGSIMDRKLKLGEQFALQVDTGSAAGTDKILFLTVAYEEAGTGIIRREYIFPNQDGFKNTLKEVTDTARQNGTYTDKSTWVDLYVNSDHIKTMASLGQAPNLGNKKPLSAFSSDYYLFTTQYQVAEYENGQPKILYFEAFGENVEMEHEGGKNEWALAAMRLFKVNDFFGMSSYGYGGTLNQQVLLEFKGRNVASFSYSGKPNLAWDTDRHFLFFDQDMPLEYRAYTPTAIFKFNREPTDYTTGKVRENSSVGGIIDKKSDEESEYLFKLDFSDVYGAGIEGLVNFVTTSKTKAPIKDMGLAESLTLQLVYTDTNQTRKEVSLPVITSSIAWAVDHGVDRNTAILAYAQQSDSIVFSAYLPEMSGTVTEAYLTFGLVENWGDTTGASQTAQSSIAYRADAIKKDAEIHLDRLQIYAPGTYTASATVEKDIIVPVVTGTPIYRMQVGDNGTLEESGGSIRNGIVMSYGARTDIKNALLAVTTPVSDSEISEYSKYDNYYMLILKTADSAMAATKGNPEVSIGYTTASGKQETSAAANVRDAGRDFYGYWPGVNDENVMTISQYEDVTSNQITNPGGEVKMLFQLRDAVSIDTIKIAMPSEAPDDWQVSEIRILELRTLGKRYGQWQDVTNSYGGFMSDRIYNRDINPGMDDAALWTYTFAPSDWQDFILVRPGETQIVALGETTIIEKEPDIDWTDVRYSMDEVTAMGDLGFKLGRMTYRVAVQVAGEENSTLKDGDCGSVNNFYFQLQFANGESGYILANQQLSGDGFRTGYIENLTIKTNRDYGELKAVHIIPDDISENNQIADKLNIEKIEVYRQSDEAVNRTWVIDNVGWIGYDYFDEGTKQSTRGREGRSEGEIARTYPVSYATYSTKLLFEIATVGMAGASEAELLPLINSATTEEEKQKILKEMGQPNQYQGQMAMQLNYLDSKGADHSVKFDVVQLMADFAGKTSNSSYNSATGRGTMGISDVNYMFRFDKTDRFEVEVQDLQQLISANFTITGVETQTTFLKMIALNVFMLTGSGKLNITDNNEYDKTNPRTQICTGLNPPYTVWCPAATPEPYNVSFSTHKLTVQETEESWEVSTPRIPDTEEDKFNVYVYLNNRDDMNRQIVFNEGVGTDGRALNNLRCQIVYSTNHDLVYKTAARSLTMFTDSADGLSCFASLGIDASDVSVLNKVCLTMGNNNASAYIDHIVVQQIREDVVIHTYAIDVSSNITGSGVFASGSATSKPLEKENGKQVVTLGFTDNKNAGTVTETARLIAENRDIAVSLEYTSKNDKGYKQTGSGGEVFDKKVTYRSPYIYLTDQQILSIVSGGTAELTFNEKFVDEVTGIYVIATGGLKAYIDKACVAVYEEEIDGTYGTKLKRTGWYDMWYQGSDTYKPVELGPGAEKLIPYTTTSGALGHTVTPMRVSFVTANAKNAIPYGDVMMYVTYHEEIEGKEVTKEFSIRDNMIQGSFNNVGTAEEDRTVVVRVLLTDLIRALGPETISLKFKDADNNVEDVWNIEQMWLEYDYGADATMPVVRRGPYGTPLGGDPILKGTNSNVYNVEKEDDVLLTATVIDDDGREVSLKDGETISVLPGATLYLRPHTAVNAHAKNVGTVTVEKYDAATGTYTDLNLPQSTTTAQLREWRLTVGAAGEKYRVTFGVETNPNKKIVCYLNVGAPAQVTNLLNNEPLLQTQSPASFFAGMETLNLSAGWGSYTLIPQNAVGTVTWYSSDPKIVTVTNGFVQAAPESQIGQTATIIAEDGAGNISRCSVTIVAPVVAG